MKPWISIDRARLPDGRELTLHRRDREFVIRAGGAELMSSRLHASEDELARLGCERARHLKKPRVLVGGLGMGFTLRAALDVLPSAATVIVAELMAAVVEWNRGPLAPLAGAPLDDPRVRVEVNDVVEVLRQGGFDAVLLDVDNGPSAISQPSNANLYDEKGIARIAAALEPGGVFVLWSAGEDRGFEARLRRAGFSVETRRVRGREKKGPRHTLFLATLAA